MVAVNIKTRKIVWVERNRTEAAAEGVVKMAVFRQGVAKQFYAAVPAGTYNDGDIWNG